LAFVNLDTGEAVLCQLCDSQTYVRTVHKLRVYGPSEILIVSTAASRKSKLFSIIEENLDVIESKLTLLDRRYWAESTGFDYIQSLAFAEDVDAIKVSVAGNYYAVCCVAAVSTSDSSYIAALTLSTRSSSTLSLVSEKPFPCIPSASSTNPLKDP
jgi:DNA mismatch repair protein MSH4